MSLASDSIMGGIRIIACALLASWLAVPGTAGAGSLSAVLNGKSFHLDSSHEWNEDNLGLGLEYAFDSPSKWQKVLMVNAFRDSDNNMSYMAGAGLHRRLLQTERLQDFYIDAGINFFVMTREDYHDNRPFPGLLPSVTIGNRNMGLNVTYLPKKVVEEVLNTDIVDPSLSGVLFLQFKVNIDRLLPSSD